MPRASLAAPRRAHPLPDDLQAARGASDEPAHRIGQLQPERTSAWSGRDEAGVAQSPRTTSRPASRFAACRSPATARHCRLVVVAGIRFVSTCAHQLERIVERGHLASEVGHLDSLVAGSDLGPRDPLVAERPVTAGRVSFREPAGGQS
jgi:hypothetical protein